MGLLDAAAQQAPAARARPVARAAHRRPGGRLHRPLPVLLQGPEGTRARRLPQDPERHRRRRAPHAAHLPGGGRRPAVARPLGRDLRHHAGPDVRALPAQGRHRARLGRRHRRLRPGVPHHDQRGHPPHEHGLLGVRGARGSRERADRAVARHARDRRRAVPRSGGPRPVPAARPVLVPALIHSWGDHSWISALSCRPTRPPRGSWSTRGRRSSTASATRGPSTRTCSGRSPMSSTARSWRRPASSSSARW